MSSVKAGLSNLARLDLSFQICDHIDFALFVCSTLSREELFHIEPSTNLALGQPLSVPLLLVKSDKLIPLEALDELLDSFVGHHQQVEQNVHRQHPTESISEHCLDAGVRDKIGKAHCKVDRGQDNLLVSQLLDPLFLLCKRFQHAYYNNEHNAGPKAKK